MSGFREEALPAELSGGPECAGCGMRGQTGQCGSDTAPVMLGYECGCLQAFSDVLAEVTWRGAELLPGPKARREGKS